MSKVAASNVSNNATSECAADVLDRHSTGSLYVYPSIPFGGVIMLLNMLVIVSVIKNKRLHKPAYYYVCSLALADLIAAFNFTFSFLWNYFKHGRGTM